MCTAIGYWHNPCHRKIGERKISCVKFSLNKRMNKSGKLTFVRKMHNQLRLLCLLGFICTFAGYTSAEVVLDLLINMLGINFGQNKPHQCLAQTRWVNKFAINGLRRCSYGISAQLLRCYLCWKPC